MFEKRESTTKSLLNAFFAEKYRQRTVKKVAMENENRKNIAHYEISDIEGFLQRDSEVGSYVISGGDAKHRAKSTAAVISHAMYKGLPVIVLHEGNTVLENQVLQATSFSENKLIISNGMEVYDPFYNRTNKEIWNLISLSAGDNMKMKSDARQYVNGITDFIRSKNIPPFCEMFMSCPFEELYNKLDDAQNNGFITDQNATNIRNQLMQGQDEKSNVQSFFSDLEYQGSGILAKFSNRGRVANIKAAVVNNGMIMIDIGSSSNEILFNLILNEIREVLNLGMSIVLVIDDIEADSNEILQKILKSSSSRCHTTLASEDVYAMLGGNANLFEAITGKASKCIVSAHTSGISCTKWADVFGQYTEEKISRGVGNAHNYLGHQLCFGFGHNQSMNISTSTEYIVKPEYIKKMLRNEVYILDREAGELAHTTIR